MKPTQDDLCHAIISFGADGREGGEGENADVYSWN
jgi:hypothetical protein